MADLIRLVAWFVFIRFIIGFLFWHITPYTLDALAMFMVVVLFVGMVVGAAAQKARSLSR